MDHQNIARVLEAGSTPGPDGTRLAGRLYCVMELVHGVPVTTYCDDNHLTPKALRGRLIFGPASHVGRTTGLTRMQAEHSVPRLQLVNWQGSGIAATTQGLEARDGRPLLPRPRHGPAPHLRSWGHRTRGRGS